MRIAALAVGLAMAVAGGCQQFRASPRDAEVATFGAASLRIHSSFTQIKDSNEDGRPDSIEAFVEFRDQFGDQTKAAGTVMFELFEYRQADPDPRGPRIGDPWIGSIVTLAEQQASWSKISRTYRFALRADQIKPDRNYVLSAMFQAPAGGRLFDSIVLSPLPPEAKPTAPASNVVTQPTTRTPQP